MNARGVQEKESQMKTHAEKMKFLRDSGCQMYSREGGREVLRLLNAMESGVKAGILTADTLANAVASGVSKIEKTHPEVHDTEPRYLIWQTAIDLARECWSEKAAQKVLANLEK
jgi:hypothetical protein